MKKLLMLAMIVVMTSMGCRTVKPGNDVIVVRAEQAQDMAFETIVTFLKLEHSQRAVVKQKWPKVHAFAEFLREDIQIGEVKMSRGFTYVVSMNNVKLAYKVNKTEENRMQLIASIAALEQMLTEVRAHMLTINTLKEAK